MPTLIRSDWARARDERGVALVVALMATTLLMALGIALTLTTMTEGRIAANYRDGTETLYAADAAVERVMQDILTVPDWNDIIGGTLTSAFIDGPPTGVRTLDDGTVIDLAQATNLVNCGGIAACGAAQMDTPTAERPWGANNPRWKLYAYGPMRDMLPTEVINSGAYVIVWIADDPAENDGNPQLDGGPPSTCNEATDADCTNHGRGVLAMLAHAYGPGGSHRAVEVTVARTNTVEIERGYTGQRGQDEQNRRARKAAVQTPGRALTRSTFSIGS